MSSTSESREEAEGGDSDEQLLEDADLTPMEAPVPKALSTSRRLGRYVLSHEIASGGMATVNLARAEGPGGFEKVVAIKSIHAHLAKDRAFVQMFLDEARIASRIDHPNVCRVFDFGEAEGTHYIVMEYIVGETLVALHQRAFARAEPEERRRLSVYAAHIIADACEGLHAAHELRDEQGKLLGLVHRDVSPHNLFACYDGSVRLLDFGVAKVSGRPEETRSGVLKGKLAYMAPEQVRRQPVDRRADLWAMGVVLWELVTGQRLFRRASEVETLLAIERETPPLLREKCPTLAPELEAIVGRALAREPAQRYATAREMARDLNRFVGRSDEPVGVAEMAEWMESLFGATRDERLRAIDEARGTDAHTRPHAEAEGSATTPSLGPPDAARPPRPPPPPRSAPAKASSSSAVEPASEATMVRLDEQAPAALNSGRPSLGAFAPPPSSDLVVRESLARAPEADASTRATASNAAPAGGERLANVGVALALVALLALGIAGAFAFTQRGPRVVLVAEPPGAVDAGVRGADAAEGEPEAPPPP